MGNFDEQPWGISASGVTGTQYFRHPLVGDLDLEYESFDLTTDIGQTMVVYTAEPDSPAHTALDALAQRTDATHRAEPEPDAGMS